MPKAFHWVAGLLLPGVCQTPETPALPPRLVPLLETMAPRPDTLYTYFQNRERCTRIPVVADQLNTTRQALLRLSFRVLSHSAD